VYTLDRWAAYCDQNSKFSVQQNAGSVTPPTGFSNYLGVTSLSAYTVGASEAFGVSQLIEGFNTADFGFGSANAKTVTLSFQVYSSLTGTFGGSLRNSASNRSYPFTYTISSANTWTSISVTIAGDTSGTWIGATNGKGLSVWFSLGAGSTYTGTASAWAGANYLQPTGATSVVGTNGATFYITGVQLEKGSTATSFDYRPYGTELALCQRYFQQILYDGGTYPSIGGYITNGGTVDMSFPYQVTMRANPTVTKNGTWNVSGNNGQPTVLGTSTSGFSLRITGTASGQGYAYGQSSTTTVTSSAEL